MVLIYGNKYTENREETNKKYDEDVIRGATFDYLETEEEYFKDECGNLPEDWFSTFFWREIV